MMVRNLAVHRMSHKIQVKVPAPEEVKDNRAIMLSRGAAA